MVTVKLTNGDVLRFHDADGFEPTPAGVMVGNSSFVPMSNILWITALDVPETEQLVPPFPPTVRELS